MRLRPFLKRVLPQNFRRRLREFLVAYDVKHLSGPKRLNLADNEAIVTCVVKNGEFYVDCFVQHYTRMGFRHIFFLDNGSTDRTIAIAQRYSNVSIKTTTLPIEAHQPLFKKYLAQSSARGGWRFYADIDELFDYPFSDRVSLREFLEYLNQKQFTAVVTQLLDMFSDKPLSALSRDPGQDLAKVYRYYDLSDITRMQYKEADIVNRYGRGNEVTDSRSALYFGGIRKTLYGNNCLLTTHSLFVPRKPIELFPHVHFVNNAKLADVSCVTRHYKLTSNALAIAAQNKRAFSGNSKGYSDFIQFLTNQATKPIKTRSSVMFHCVDELVDKGFLIISPEYRAIADAKANKTALGCSNSICPNSMSAKRESSATA